MTCCSTATRTDCPPFCPSRCGHADVGGPRDPPVHTTHRLLGIPEFGGTADAHSWKYDLRALSASTVRLQMPREDFEPSWRRSETLCSQHSCPQG